MILLVVFLSRASVFNKSEQKYYYFHAIASLSIEVDSQSQISRIANECPCLNACFSHTPPRNHTVLNFQPQSKTIKHKRIDRGATNPKAKYLNNI